MIRDALEVTQGARKEERGYHNSVLCTSLNQEKMERESQKSSAICHSLILLLTSLC